MTAAFVQEVGQWDASLDGLATEALSLSVSVATGHLLVLMWQNGTDNTNLLSSVTDSKSNTWTVLTPSDDSGGAFYSAGMAYAYMTAGLVSGTDTITLHWTNGEFCYKFGSIFEFSGTASSSILDAQAVTTDTFGSSVSIPITTVTAGDVVVALVAQENDQTYTVGGSFTDQSNQVVSSRRGDYLWRVVTTATGYNPAGTLGTTDDYRGAIAAFKAGSGVSPPGPDTPPTIYAPLVNASGAFGA